MAWRLQVTESSDDPAMNRVERWRFQCPHGHTNWEVHENVFTCRGCARHDRPQSTKYLEDRKTGELVTPAEFKRLVNDP